MSPQELEEKKAVFFVDVVLSGKLLSDMAQHLNRPFKQAPLLLKALHPSTICSAFEIRPENILRAQLRELPAPM